MKPYIKTLIFQLSFVFLLFLTSCATHPRHLKDYDQLAYVADHEDTLIRQHLPVFIISDLNEKHNLIGTPGVRTIRETGEDVYINPEIATIYAETRKFTTQKDSYTNLIYRVHFEKVPFSIFPFHLGWGKNVGVIVVITLDSRDMPILYTTVETCGCYLAFIPTTYMPHEAFPDDWNIKNQAVYGEQLPGLLDFKDVSLSMAATLIFIKKDSHRLENISVSNIDRLNNYKKEKAFILPLESLEKLPLKGPGSSSFYEYSGRRKGYVKDSSKPLEKLLMSWWALDWEVGTDKKLGRGKEDGPLFYTSLKPWARHDSDMRDFATFLKYWGWKL